MNKKVKIGIIISLVLFLGLAIFAFVEPRVSKIIEEKNFIKVKEVQLTEDNRRFHEEQVRKSDEQINNASSDEVKMNAYLGKGFNLQALGKLEEAKLAFEIASTIKTDSFAPHKALFDVKVEMQDFAGARESARKSIELAPHIADTWVRYIEFENSKTDMSNDDIGFLYIEALSKTKDHPDIITNYARFLESVGNLQSAKEYWLKAAAINPPNAALYTSEATRLDQLMK